MVDIQVHQAGDVERSDVVDIQVHQAGDVERTSKRRQGASASTQVSASDSQVRHAAQLQVSK